MNERAEPGPWRQTLPRARRIQSRSDFRRIYAGGRKLHGRLAVVFSSPAASPEGRLGITATKKLGPAVVRNRLKRRVREIYRRGGRLLARDLVVNLRAEACEASYEMLREDLARLFERLGAGR